MHTNNNNYRMICKRNINDVGPTNSDVGGGGGAGAGYGLYQAAGAAAAGTGAYQHPNSWALEPQSSWPMTVGGGGGGYFLQQQQLLRQQQQQQQLQSVPQLVPIGNRRNGGITTTNSSILQFHPSPPRYNHSHNLSYSHFNTNFNNVSNNNISNTHFNTNTYFSNSLATVSQWPISVIGDEEEEERVVKEEEEELEDDDDSKLQELVNSFDLDLDNIEVPRRAAPLESSPSSSLSLLGEHSAAFLSLKELAEAADFEPDNEVPRPPPAPAARRASHPQQQPRGRSASVLSILDEHDHFEGTSSNGGGIEVSQPVRRSSQPRRQSSSGSGSSSLLSSSSGSGSEHHFYRRRSSGALSVLSSSSDHPASFKEQLYKTELCRNMAELGVCDFGKECYFAHSEAEKRQAEGRKLHPNHRTVHCIEWNRGNVCKFGRRCAFIHRKPKTAFSVVGLSEETGKPELSPALWDALLSCGDFEPRLFGESALI